MVTFIGLYLGIVFLIAGAAILALKELSESADNMERYRMLRKLGVENRMLNGALFRQIFIFFLCPMVLAVIHSYFGIFYQTSYLCGREGSAVYGDNAGGSDYCSALWRLSDHYLF